MEEKVIQELEKLLEATKNYENTMRNVFFILGSQKSELPKMAINNSRINELLNEFEIVYKRIQEEI